MFDYKVGCIGYYGIWEVRSSEYFIQNIGMLYHFKGKLNNRSTGFLVKYKLSNSLTLQTGSENKFTDAYGNPLTVNRTTTTVPTGNLKWGCQINLRYKLPQLSHLQTSHGLVYQISEPSSKVEEVYKINQQDYQYSYERKSAF